MSTRVIYNVDRTMPSIYDTVSVWGQILPDDDRASAQADVELATVSEVLDPDPRKEHRRPFSSRIHKYRIRRTAAQESALAGSGLSAGRAIPAEDNVEVGKVFGTKMPGAGRPMDKEPLTTALSGHGVSPGSECRFRDARRRVSSPLDAEQDDRVFDRAVGDGWFPDRGACRKADPRTTRCRRGSTLHGRPARQLTDAINDFLTKSGRPPVA